MELIEPTLQMWLVFATIVAAIAAYSVDRIPLEISSFASVVLLMVLFYAFPVVNDAGEPVVTNRDLLIGFADPALITIMALLVVGQALVQTGALNGPAQTFVAVGAKAPGLTIFTCFVIVMAVSAVLNNTPVVVIFIPIMSVLAEKLGRRTSSVMMPLSFVAILGGNLTIIGSSTNLLAIGTYQLEGYPAVDFFEFTMPGAVMAGVGLLYVAFVAPRLLVDRSGISSKVTQANGKQFLFQMELEPGNTMIGKTAVSGLFPGLKDMTVRMIERGKTKILPPYDGVTLEEGDIVLVAATRSVMTELLNNSPTAVSDAEGEAHEDTRQVRLIAEAVVAPASRLDGRTIAMTGFRSETGCAVLGVQRRSRMIRAALSQLRLEAGDVLLVMGARDNIMGLRNNPDVLLMESSASDLPKQAFANRASLIFAGVVLTAATGLVPIVLAALFGAVLMLATGCLNIRQASRSIDRRVFAIVGAALALGTAMKATGGATWLAHATLAALEGAPEWVILSGLFLLIALLTNVLSNNATAVLFTPIAVSIATELQVDPIPLLVTVIFAANCSFATPMSYQTNLLVMAPGHYRFKDFMLVGSPLILIQWLTFTLFIPWYYGIV